MNNLQVFVNEEFGQVRTMLINDVPWFVGKDLANALGYTNSRKALADHVDKEDKGVTKCDTLGGTQEMTVVNESGMYALIFGSKLEEARRFKHWVTAEVLPSIRKTGSYTTNTADRLKNATLPEITNFLHETSSFLREMDKVMRDQNSHPSDIAEEFKSVCEQFGIVELSDNFVKEPAVDKYAFRPLSWITGNPEDDNVDVDYDY